jgi:hypothetical protein
MTGVVFDQLYTDTLIDLVSPQGAYTPRLPILKRMPRQDTLLSLVLFGKAYLQAPLWLSNFEATQALAPLMAEDLVEILPLDIYDAPSKSRPA